jgi:hypothetical protein
MSLITGDQLLAHLVGDYAFQSDWMATNKKTRIWPCLVHVLTYAIPFLFLPMSPLALLVIVATHFAIDHWHFPQRLVWAKNWLLATAEYRKDPKTAWKACSFTGCHPDRPVWLAVWLLIILDNTLHLIVNALAIRHL